MSKVVQIDPAQKALEIATKRAMSRAKKKPVNFAVTRILKRNKFSPISILLTQVYPQLPPEKQADVIFKLMDYLYPKMQREDASGRKRKGPGIQTNVQVNVPSNTTPDENIKELPPAQPQFSLEELLAIAAPNQSSSTKPPKP